jgi:hypothetical protein
MQRLLCSLVIYRKIFARTIAILRFTHVWKQFLAAWFTDHDNRDNMSGCANYGVWFTAGIPGVTLRLIETARVTLERFTQHDKYCPSCPNPTQPPAADGEVRLPTPQALRLDGKKPVRGIVHTRKPPQYGAGCFRRSGIAGQRRGSETASTPGRDPQPPACDSSV